MEDARKRAKFSHLRRACWTAENAEPVGKALFAPIQGNDAVNLARAPSYTTVTLDKAGRVVIPKTLRDELHLEAGDRMELESAGESFTLRPVRSASPMRKEHGVWVFRGNKRLTAAATDRVLGDLRDQRDVNNRGARP